MNYITDDAFGQFQLETVSIFLPLKNLSQGTNGQISNSSNTYNKSNKGSSSSI
jgi:hypothetical protein